jgi:nucleolar protein 53
MLLDLAVKKKIEKHREKVLRVDSVLQKNQFVKPVPSSTLKKNSKNRKVVSKSLGANQDSHKVSKLLDNTARLYYVLSCNHI